MNVDWVFPIVVISLTAFLGIGGFWVAMRPTNPGTQKEEKAKAE